MVVFFAGASFLPARTFFGALAAATFETLVVSDFFSAFLGATAFTPAVTAFDFVTAFLAPVDLAATAFVEAALAGRALVTGLATATFAGLFYKRQVRRGHVVCKCTDLLRCRGICRSSILGGEFDLPRGTYNTLVHTPARSEGQDHLWVRRRYPSRHPSQWRGPTECFGHCQSGDCTVPRRI